MGGRAALRAFELGPVEQYNLDGSRKGRKAFLAVEAKAQRHEILGNWSVWSVRQKMRLGK